VDAQEVGDGQGVDRTSAQKQVSWYLPMLSYMDGQTNVRAIIKLQASCRLGRKCMSLIVCWNHSGPVSATGRDVEAGWNILTLSSGSIRYHDSMPSFHKRQKWEQSQKKPSPIALLRVPGG